MTRPATTPLVMVALVLRPMTKPRPRTYSKAKAANYNSNNANDKVCKDTGTTTKLRQRQCRLDKKHTQNHGKVVSTLHREYSPHQKDTTINHWQRWCNFDKSGVGLPNSEYSPWRVLTGFEHVTTNAKDCSQGLRCSRHQHQGH